MAGEMCEAENANLADEEEEVGVAGGDDVVDEGLCTGRGRLPARIDAAFMERRLGATSGR